MRKALCRILIVFTGLAILAGCSPKISLLGEAATDPLKQSVLEGKGRGKVLVLPVSGFIGVGPRQGLLHSRPGMVQEVSAILKKAAKDKDVKALVLLIDSPGGTVAGTDMLSKEIEGYKTATGAKVVAQCLTLCASGGYYLALGADEIQATPASVVGSVGTLFISPKLAGLMGKIGVEAEVTKSGELKDMASPFRPSTVEEKRLTQEMIDQMNSMFLIRVASKRHLDQAGMDEVAKAGVYTGMKALELKLVDRLGYPKDALDRARALAGLPEDAKVVVYRRSTYHDDTYYNAAIAEGGGEVPKSLGLSIGLETLGLPVEAGFHYLWPQALPGDWR